MFGSKGHCGPHTPEDIGVLMHLASTMWRLMTNIRSNFKFYHGMNAHIGDYMGGVTHKPSQTFLPSKPRREGAHELGPHEYGFACVGVVHCVGPRLRVLREKMQVWVIGANAPKLKELKMQVCSIDRLAREALNLVEAPLLRGLIYRSNMSVTSWHVIFAPIR